MKGTWKNVRVTVDEALFSNPDLKQMIEYAKRGALGLARAQGWNFKSEMLTAQIACNTTKLGEGNQMRTWFQLTWTSSTVVNNFKRMNLFKSVQGNQQSAISFERVKEAVDNGNFRELLWK